MKDIRLGKATAARGDQEVRLAIELAEVEARVPVEVAEVEVRVPFEVAEIEVRESSTFLNQNSSMNSKWWHIFRQSNFLLTIFSLIFV